MSDKLLGSDINPKATVQAKTDMSENYELSDGFNPFDYIEKPKPENLEVSVGDALKAATTSGLRSVQGIFEIPNQINHSSTEKAYMQRVPEELRTEAKPTPFEDKRKSLSNIAVDKLGGWADSVQATMSSDAQKAMHTPFYRDGEVSSDPAVWGIQFANLVGYMAPTVATMIATRKVPVDNLAPNIKRLMLRSGVSAEMAEKALPHTLNAIKNAPALGVGVASDVGSQGVQAREMLLNASHEQLMQSPTYIQAFRDIHADPENTGLSNEQKFELAKERVSNIASQDTMTDPKTIAASVLATGFGDVALSRAVLSGTAKSAGGLRGAATGFLKGGTKEGGLEFGQEYTTQRVSNEISNKHAGTNLDLDSGAMDAGINGLIGGFVMGSGMGTVGGLRSVDQSAIPEAETAVDENAVDVSATVNPEQPVASEIPNEVVAESPEINIAADTTRVDVSATADFNNEPKEFTPDPLKAKQSSIDSINRHKLKIINSLSKLRKANLKAKDGKSGLFGGSSARDAKALESELRALSQVDPSVAQQLVKNIAEIYKNDSNIDLVEMVGRDSSLGQALSEILTSTASSATKIKDSYTKAEVSNDMDAPAYLRKILRHEAGPQQQQGSADVDQSDFDIPAYQRQGKAVNMDPEAVDVSATENLPAVSDVEGEWIGADEQQGEQQPEPASLRSIEQQHQPRLKGENIIYGDAPQRESVDDHMEQQTSQPQFSGGEQVKGQQFIPREESAAVNDETPQIDGHTVVIDGEYHTVGKTGLVPSDARPSVIYGRSQQSAQVDTTDLDKQVGEQQFDGGIPKKKLRQLKYLAQRRDAKIPLAMQRLKGSARFTRPEYRERLVSLADEATSLGNSKEINTQIDTISGAIAKIGGINREVAQSEGIDPASFKRNKLFPATGGRTFDELAELLNEHGFTSRGGSKLSANDVLDLVDGEVNSGERHFSSQSDALTETHQGSALADMVREYGAERVQTAIGKALTGARLGDRQAEIVNEAMDVIETGRIEQAGGIESRRAERDMRRETRSSKRKQQLDQVTTDLALPDWVTDSTTAQAESEYNETVEAALDEAIKHAAVADPDAGDLLLDKYESGLITMASLIEQLGALNYADRQKLTNVENTQPVTQGADSESASQRAREGQENPQQTGSAGHRPDDSGTGQRAEQSVGGIEENDRGSDRKNEVEAVAEKPKPRELASLDPEDKSESALKAKLEDVGEKIGGARKDVWNAYADSIEGKTDSDIQQLTLSKAWPQPNYQAMLNQGVSLEALSLFRAVRDSITAKPRSAFKLARWAKSVHMMRDIALGAVNGSIEPQRAKSMLMQASSRESHKIAGRAELYEVVGHENSLSNFALTSGNYSLFAGESFETPKTIWTVERASGGGFYGNWPRQIAHGNTKEEAIAAFKEKYDELMNKDQAKRKAVSFDIYTKRGENGYFIGKKVGRGYIDLEGPIESVKDARLKAIEDNDGLVKKLENAKFIPAPRRDLNNPRVGEDLRQSGDVSADDFAKVFGFRGVEFGNWVDQKKRQSMVNDAYDSLMDMAAILGISPKAISLNGELGLAFGARGKGGADPAKAHYEPGKVVINLTKNRGAGSLGHEWWHALDNYFAKMNTGSNSSSDAFMTEPSYRAEEDSLVRAEMRKTFADVMGTINQSDLAKRSRKLDAGRSKDYWSTPVEMSARSFESYLIAKLADQNATNDFLANIVSEDAWNVASPDGSKAKHSYPYPNQSESQSIRRSFEHLFNVMDQHEFDDGRVMLYSREGVTIDSGNQKGMPLKQAELAVKSWLRQYNGGAAVSVKVVQTQVEAEKLIGASFDGYKVNAFYDEVSASVVVVADNIANTKELRKKLRHEVLVHHGLRAVVGDTEYGRILKTVYSGLGSKYLKDLISDVEQSYDKSDLNGFVEEVIAHAAEVDRGKVGQWMDRIVAAIAQALRKVGLMAPSDMTKAELNNIVHTLTDRIKSVNEWGPDNTPPDGSGSGRLSRTKFSRSATNSKQHSSSFLSDVAQARAKIAAHVTGPKAETAAGGFDIPTENLKSTIARKWADKFQVLKELQRNIKEAGGTVTEDNDAYLAEELFHGKAENDLRIMKDTFVKPLADKMAKFNISQADLDEYLIARHAQERNEYIASINPKFSDGGSGMKTQDAKDKLNAIRSGGKQRQYDELAHIVDAMIARQRDVLRDSGLETDEVLDTWQAHYQYYVPLKGIAKDESSLPRTGKGFSIGGKEAKTAKGRKSQAESPSGHAILDLTEKLVRARKNEVGNSLLKLVEDNPSSDYWQVFTNDNPDKAPQIVERKNPLTGEKEKVVEDRAVPMSMMPDHYFPTKKDGKVYYIKLHDQRLMNAMKNIGPDTSNGLIRVMATFNRFLASVNTTYNPEFVIGNFARDIQTAVLNLSAEQTRDDGKIKGKNIAKQVIADIGKAMPAVYASLTGKKAKTAKGREWQQYFDEFMADGGKTGWFDMKDVDGQAKDLERMVAMASGTAKGKAYKTFDMVTGFVENMNGSIENAVRLSAYVNARKVGVSRKKAASLAKNMTVNFNRRGESGTTLNALYMFANASIQGSANFVRTMVGLNGDGKLKWGNLNRAQKLAVGIVSGSFAIAMMNRSAAGEDDDGVNWYDKVPSYVKERNLVIMKSLVGGEADGTYWSIPLPYGYNIFAVMGSGIESAMNSDNTTPAEAAGSMALATLGAFSPIGMHSSETVSGTVLKGAAPTVFKPVVEVALNENFFGSNIYQENMPFGTQMPASSLGKRSTGDHYKAVAKWLNEQTGGSAFRSGGIDISPDVMKYFVGYFGGAAFRFADVKVPGLIDKVSGGDIDDNKVAFLSRISGKVMPYADQSKFYERREELMQIKEEAKVTFGEERPKFMTEYGDKLKLMPLLKSTEKQLKALRNRRNAIYAMDVPQKDKDLRIKNLERDMKRVVDGFNKAYAGRA
ncbi:LPD38 domain-containing protein [Photobacterium nomapromontoriensis]|uniref:LPD38 domain-containing protein n=1 Tax=Photobacterium nomapromontoriensis TaxID=2910237 RepID=UPI003D0B39A2